MKGIMYHYVRPYDPQYPNFNNLDIENFKKQLDYFEKTFGFVSKKDFENSLRNNRPAEGVILTFDDGLSCHYNYVFPELKRRNLWGIFYIATQPYFEKRMLDVHRIHLLLGKYESKDVYNELNNLIDNSYLDKEKLDEFKKFTYSTQDNDYYTLLVKRLLNYFIAYEHRENVINRLMEQFIPNENEILKEYYLTREQITQMHKEGMIIGAHSVNHPVMSRLNVKEQYEQINGSFNFLNDIVQNFEHKTFCYPYGGFHSFNDQTVSILEDSNCLYTFNVEQRDIEASDLELRRHALPRYDCNQFKFGQVTSK